MFLSSFLITHMEYVVQDSILFGPTCIKILKKQRIQFCVKSFLLKMSFHSICFDTNNHALVSNLLIKVYRILSVLEFS